MSQTVTSQNVISQPAIDKLRQRLEQHPVYAAVSTLEDLQVFMQHHVYSVWDFMSLIKYLQARITPTRVPWVPQGDQDVRRFINELVLEEETDQSHVEGGFSSHFELYLQAMEEIGADTGCIRQFIDVTREQGIDAGLALDCVPSPSRQFTATTFAFINNDQAHEVAAALALGREHIIPCMFRAILDKIGVSADDAPIFHFYLNRHIHLDEDFHAPLSLKLLAALCDGDTKKIAAAEAAASQSVDARITFWDGVLANIQTRQKEAAA